MDLPLDSLSLNSNEEEDSLLLNQTSSLSLEDGTPQDHRINFLRNTSAFKHEYTPRTSSPLKSSFISSTDQLDKHMEDVSFDDSDVIMQDDDVDDSYNSSFTSQFARRTSMMLKPTILGAKVATQGSPLHGSHRSSLSNRLQGAINTDSEEYELDDDSNIDILESSSTSTTSQSSPIKQSKVRKRSNLSTNSTVSEDSEEETSQETEDSEPNTPSKWISQNTNNNNKQPIQFQMHHHHYYPQPINQSFSEYDSEDDSILPAPWSKVAEPKAPTPYIISSYLQLLFNAITSSVAIYILIGAIRTVKSDINSKMEEYAQDIAMEVSVCARNYIENKCHPDTRANALEELCISWERCMNRDPTLIATKSSISAETLGLILNSLIEPVGGKAIVVVVLAFVVWSFTSNFVFGFLRAKSYYGWNSSNSNVQNSSNNGLPSGNLLRYNTVPENHQITYHS